MPDANDPVYMFNKHGSKGKRVGQAAIDLLSKDQPTYTAGEILDGFGDDYVKEMEVAVNRGIEKFQDPFYVLVLTKKEPWMTNVIRNYFAVRQTAPYARDLIAEYKHHTKTLYIVNGKKGQIKLLWSLPGWEDCKVVSRRPDIYDPDLVSWIRKALEGKLDRDKYSFDEAA